MNLLPDLIFPTLRGITYPIAKTPQWNTKIQTSASGVERTASYWATPRWTFKLSLTYVEDTGDPTDIYNQLLGLFMQCRGSFGSFLFCDNEVTRQKNTYTITPNITNVFTVNSISFGGYSQPIDENKTVFNQFFNIDYGLPIYASDPDTTTDYMDEPDTYMDDPDTYMGTDRPNFVLTSDYLINGTTITAYGYRHTGYFPPGSTTIKATFNYYFRCRFLQDQTDFETFAYNLTENKSVEMITLK